MKQNYNFTGFILVPNLVSHLKGRPQIVGAWEQRLRRIFGPKREEVTGEWRNIMRNFIICTLVYSSLSIIKVIKSRRIKWVGHVAHMSEERHKNLK
jgi:hypothetical protein